MNFFTYKNPVLHFIKHSLHNSANIGAEYKSMTILHLEKSI